MTKSSNSNETWVDQQVRRDNVALNSLQEKLKRLNELEIKDKDFIKLKDDLSRLVKDYFNNNKLFYSTITFIDESNDADLKERLNNRDDFHKYLENIEKDIKDIRKVVSNINFVTDDINDLKFWLEDFNHVLKTKIEVYKTDTSELQTIVDINTDTQEFQSIINFQDDEIKADVKPEIKEENFEDQLKQFYAELLNIVKEHPLYWEDKIKGKGKLGFFSGEKIKAHGREFNVPDHIKMLFENLKENPSNIKETLQSALEKFKADLPKSNSKQTEKQQFYIFIENTRRELNKSNPSLAKLLPELEKISNNIKNFEDTRKTSSRRFTD